MKLFASVLRLDRTACKMLKITDTYSLHRVVYSLFEDIRSNDEKNASIKSGIQWVDKGGDALNRQILILSNREPRHSMDDKSGEVITKCLPVSFLSHKTYRFEVVINPTRRNNQSQKLIPVVGRDAIAHWFIERAAKSWGFSVSQPQLQVDSINVLKFNAKHPVTVQQAKLSGYLTVIDAEQFAQSFAKGIGRNRSFGCGLLQIVPIIESPLF